MASLVKSYKQEKLQGKVYTPDYIVEKILNDIQYTSINILGKSVVDPACGDGQFLIEVARRIIRFSSIENLAKNLDKLYGWDIDRNAVTECIKNLDELIKPFDIHVNWNVKVFNSIMHTDDSLVFDFVVGNPPYIRIQHLDLTMRLQLKNYFFSCKLGSTDIFIAFFELAYRLLSHDGICGFITPNSYFYSNTARTLRNFFVIHSCIKQISNFGHFQIFESASTYSAITIFSKERNSDFLLEEAYSNYDFLSRRISCESLRISKPWQLSVTKIISDEGIRLGDIASIHVGITTLCDRAYIFKARYYNEEFMVAETRLEGDILIESQIIKPIIKASTFKALTTETEFILFPYELINGKYSIISEDKLKRNYPKAYIYLHKVRPTLDMRDNGKVNKVAWYAFGRSQGINNIKGTKIIFPPISKKPTFVIDDSESFFYSGYCIRYTGNISELAEKLNSQNMEDYISISSRDFRGGYKAYNKAVVQEFRIQN